MAKDAFEKARQRKIQEGKEQISNFFGEPGQAIDNLAAEKLRQQQVESNMSPGDALAKENARKFHDARNRQKQQEFDQSYDQSVSGQREKAMLQEYYRKLANKASEDEQLEQQVMNEPESDPRFRDDFIEPKPSKFPKLKKQLK